MVTLLQFFVVSHFLWLLVPAPPVKYGGRKDNILAENQDVQNCVFDNYHQHMPDSFPELFRTKTTCGGNMFNLGKINKEFANFADLKLFGANNVADLMAARMGNYDVKWQGDTSTLLDLDTCENHFDEMFYKWQQIYGKMMKVKGQKVLACNYFQEISDIKHENKISRYTLSKNDAEIVYKAKNIFLPPGLGLCPEHKDEVQRLAENLKAEKMDVDFCPADGYPVDSNGNNDFQYDVSAQLIVQEFANSFDVQRFITQCNYNTLKPDTQRKKVNSGKFLIQKLASAAAPNAENDFLKQICKSFVEPNTDEWKIALLINVAEQYEKATDDKLLRLYALSTVARLVSLREMSQFIPNITPHYFEEARNLKKLTSLPSFDTKKQYIRYDTCKIERFIDFVTSPYCLVTLPYGQKVLKLSDGSTLNIPNKMKLLRNSEIIRMYKAKAREMDQEHLLLPDSTMYGILKKCYAAEAKSYMCVDYFVAAGNEAFDKLNSIVTRWDELQLVTIDKAETLKMQLKNGQQYLKTDFKANLAMHSPVVSHCLQHALSDPKEAAFQKSCDGEHLTLCDRCAALQNVLDEMKSIADNLFNEVDKSEGNMAAVEEREWDSYEVKEAATDVEQLRAHLVRARYSDIQRVKILDELSDGVAFITLDWAQKLIGTKYWETQKDYFGKNGMSYSILHVFTRIMGKSVDHSFVNIIQGTKQDNVPVVAIVLDALINLKKMGIHSVIIRSDQAGCYHSAQTMMSLKKISEESGVKILRWSFSEAQNGKSSSDQKASVVKGRVRSYVRHKNDVTTEDEFFKALITPEPLTHTTIELNSVNSPDTVVKAKALKGISTFTEFVLENGGMKVYKFMEIGNGKLIPYRTHKPIQNLPHLTHLKQHNVLLSNGVNPTPTGDSEKELIKTLADTFYWRIVKAAKKVQPKEEYQCLENQCILKFETMEDLDEHMQIGNHQYLPEKMTALDYAMKYYSENLNSADCEDCPETVIKNHILNDQLISENLDKLKKGWAQKTQRSFPKLTLEAKQFLQKIFNDGEQSKKKSSAAAAAKKMKASRVDGRPQFRPEEVLKETQIKSYFSFLSREKGNCENITPAAARTPNTCPLPDPATDSYDENEDDGDGDGDDAAEENENNQQLRRSQRIINMHNNYIYREHEESIDEMVHEAVDPDPSEDDARLKI